jgi:D-arabinose 1-dehydrogenase-like Zn-dependent alcohol dehydrogenase
MAPVLKSCGNAPELLSNKSMQTKEPMSEYGAALPGVTTPTGNESVKMTIGFIGTGRIGKALAEKCVKAGYPVILSNRRGPGSLTGYVRGLGPLASQGTVAQAAHQDGLPAGVGKVLVPGGGGGVGSMATQWLKAKTGATVIATASRPESRQWVEQLGADMVIDHRRDMAAQLQEQGVGTVDLVFATRHSESHLLGIIRLLKRYGHLSLIDVNRNLDVSRLMPLSVSIHLETVFTRILHNEQPERQGAMLEELASLVEAGKIKSTLKETFNGLTGENIYAAHKRIEEENTIGNIVVALGGA